MRTLPLLIGPFLIAGCPSDLPNQPATERRPGVSTRAVSLCVDGDATEGFASFVLNTIQGDTIAAGDTEVTQTIDGAAPGSGKWEGGQSLNATDLDSNIHVTLVLDASSSIVESKLFEETKAAALELLTRGKETWKDRPGGFTWRVVWFNQWVWEATGEWDFDDLQTIPGPAEEDDGFTRMYAAVDFAIDQATRIRAEEGLAAGDRDTHLIVLFTDGRDNSSGRDSPKPPLVNGTTTSKATYTVHPTTVVTEDDVEAALDSRDWLQLSILSLGDDVDDRVLQGFADAAEGGQVYSGDDVEALFGRAQRSFETLQTVGWRLPLNPADPHVWRLSFQVNGLPQPASVRLDVMREANTLDCDATTAR